MTQVRTKGLRRAVLITLAAGTSLLGVAGMPTDALAAYPNSTPMIVEAFYDRSTNSLSLFGEFPSGIKHVTFADVDITALCSLDPSATTLQCRFTSMPELGTYRVSVQGGKGDKSAWGGDGAYQGQAQIDVAIEVGGTVTQLDTGTGLTGGPITTSGTISVVTGGIGSTELASGAVTTSKIADGAVTSPKLADGSVMTTKLADANVTFTKLASGGCTSGQVLKFNGTAWTCGTEASGVGTVTNVETGSGLTGGPITSSGTISADTTYLQRRVTGTCAAGSSIRMVNADGTVVCETGGQGAANAFVQGGNAFGSTAVLGTTDDKAFEIMISNTRVMRLEPNPISPNVMSGDRNNSVTANVRGATIGGGGVTADDEFAYAAPNHVTDHYGTVSGGYANVAGNGNQDLYDARYATVGGGRKNTAGGWAATVGGGSRNTASNSASTIGGGWQNTASGDSTTVAGGGNNTASGWMSAIAGGYNHTATGQYSVVGGGHTNTASADWSTVTGGVNNLTSGPASTISGGWNNTASGDSATVGGGGRNSAGGFFSFAAGFRAKVRDAQEVGNDDPNGDEGTFLWADFTDADFVSQRPNEFAVRAGGGMRVQTERGVALSTPLDRPLITGAFDPFTAAAPDYKQGLGRWGLFMEPFQLNVGMPDVIGRTIGLAKYHLDGTYESLMTVDQLGNLQTLGNIMPFGLLNSPSDVALKTAFADLSVREILRRVVGLPIRSWEFKREPAIRHVGPTAQDFHAAFGLGANDRYIATVDADGIAFAAIQGLHQIVQEKDRRIAWLERKAAIVDKLERELAEVKALVKTLVKGR